MRRCDITAPGYTAGHRPASLQSTAQLLGVLIRAANHCAIQCTEVSPIHSVTLPPRGKVRNFSLSWVQIHSVKWGLLSSSPCILGTAWRKNGATALHSLPAVVEGSPRRRTSPCTFAWKQVQLSAEDGSCTAPKYPRGDLGTWQQTLAPAFKQNNLKRVSAARHG